MIADISPGEIREAAAFGCANFKDDPYYADVLAQGGEAELTRIFEKSIDICIRFGIAKKIEHNGKVVAFLLAFNYYKMKICHRQEFGHFFTLDGNAAKSRSLEKERKFLESCMDGSKDYIYLLAVAVSPAMRRKHIASSLIHELVLTYDHFGIIADVSNPLSLGIYKREGFEFSGKADGCTIVKKKGDKPYDYGRSPRLVIPADYDAPCLQGTPYRLVRCSRLRPVHELPFFVPQTETETEARLYELDFDKLLQFQREAGLTNCIEKTVYIENAPAVCYLVSDYNLYDAEEIKKNIHTFDGEIYRAKSTEWSFIPDVITCIPIQYSDISVLQKAHFEKYNRSALHILQALEFRTEYESGVPFAKSREGFKNRIRRFYLGSFDIQLLCEQSLCFQGIEKDVPCGEAYKANIFVSVDTRSSIGVFHIVCMSCGLLLTQYLDCVSRNQINILDAGKTVNLFEYILNNYGLEKNGSAKNIITIFRDRKDVSDDLLASVMFSETLYDEGESLGRVADPEIREKLKSPNGFSQYGYAAAYSYNNLIVQLSKTLCSSVENRIVTESVTMYLAELAVFEESAICFANKYIVKYLSEIDGKSSSQTLKSYGNILSEYAKTIDFWDIQMNYTSSQKSTDEIRKAFRIDKQLEIYARNQSALKEVYQTKSDYVDKVESSILTAVGAILTVISIFGFAEDPGNHIFLGIAGVAVACLLFLKSRLFKHKNKRNKKK